MTHEGIVFGELVQPLLPDARKQLDRIAMDGLEEIGIDPREELTPLGVPGPPQVSGRASRRRSRTTGSFGTTW